MAHDIVISYATENRRAANRIRGLLEAHGITCWISDRNIHLSEAWAKAVTKAVQECVGVLVVLSKAANQSTQVPREVAIAADHEKTLLVVRIQDVKPQGELEYYLSNIQWLDAFRGPIEAHTRRLIDGISPILPDRNIQPESGLKLWVKASRGKLAAGVVVLTGLVLVIVPWPCWHGHRIQVRLLDMDTRPVEAANLATRPTYEITKTATGWEIAVPRTARPPDQKVAIDASTPDGWLSGSFAVDLGSRCASEVAIHLRPNPASTVRGTVVDPDGNALAGARVSVVDYPREAMLTDAAGSFELLAHAAAGVEVVLHIELAGYERIDQRHIAGPDPAYVVLRKN